MGHDLRVQLESVGFLASDEAGFTVAPGRYQNNEKVFDADLTVRSSNPSEIVVKKGLTYVDRPVNREFNMEIYGQKFRDGYTYVAGILKTTTPDAKLKIKGLHRIYWLRGDAFGGVKYFIGRRKGAGTVQIDSLGDKGDREKTASFRVKSRERGGDTAKLWAHQALVQENWTKGSEVLRHSLYFQVPSIKTALLAVPQEQMALFKKKEAEYQRKKRDDARQRRNWDEDRNLNYDRSSGGDPEIRVKFARAKSVTATLPDGRVLDLRSMGGEMWGGNFDIPAKAPEGDYQVIVRCIHLDGRLSTKSLTYQVDRTAPEGQILSRDGMLVVKSEPGLSQVVVAFGNGKEVMMVETEPGRYETPSQGRVSKILLIDRARNIRELK